MIPYWQMFAGICVGIAAVFFATRQNQGTSGYTSNRKESYNENYFSEPGQCAICLDEMNNSDMQYLPCGHAFHGNCIKRLRQSNKTCPICRVNI